MEFIINKHINKNLFFTSDINYVIKNSDIIFICVNTPTKDFGIGCSKATDLSFVEECFTQILNYSENDKVIVQKSTVPVGTCENLFKISKKLNKENNFCLISSPEFLAEGSAVMDLINPNRVLLGLADGTIQKKSLFFFKSALNVLYRIYLK
ncbi:hypothetical protein E5P55_00460 [Candidatus Pinguicoccus supinus]|uniref:UDP-glucose/GDP-mannose dehydrogenase N-terminal domain-containing protein n=1 Tax=Candidatus Pinguicoccus supinus TaxID=2529394 RepID=A0A7T0FXV9_9BACT|nr:hypothetical protein E5P55_00460 [Candidatus Pinguicoccus supinus]